MQPPMLMLKERHLKRAVALIISARDAEYHVQGFQHQHHTGLFLVVVRRSDLQVVSLLCLPP